MMILLNFLILMTATTSTHAATTAKFLSGITRGNCEQLLAVTSELAVQTTFYGGDEVLTPRGPRKISELRRGDSVVSLDFSSGQWLINTIDAVAVNASCMGPHREPSSSFLSPILRTDGGFDFESISRQRSLSIENCGPSYRLILISKPRNLILNREIVLDSKEQ